VGPHYFHIQKIVSQLTERVSCHPLFSTVVRQQSALLTAESLDRALDAIGQQIQVKNGDINVATMSRRHFPRQDERIVKAVGVLDAKALFDAEFDQTVGGAPFPETTARNIASFKVHFSQ